MKQQSSSIVTLALLLAAGNASAQTVADKFTLPTSVPAGTKVQIDGSSSLAAVNQGLKERFQQKFPGTDITVAPKYQGSDAGTKAVAEGKLDLAGIGRPLTNAEKAKGLRSKEVGRSKIAIIVKDSNPYKGNLTLQDFGKIYRGEITDWSQLPSANGAAGKIKVIDRPDSSDTRRAFANYPVFQDGKLKTGANAEKLKEDSTKSVAEKLGEDGIGYAPYDQIKSIPGIRAVTLHSTQPDNPKYPFSQPLVYAYKNKDGKVSDGVKAFLGYAGDPSGKQAIQESITAGAGTTAGAAAGTAAAGGDGISPAPGVNGTEAGTTGATGATGKPGKPGFPWWILAPVAAVGGLLWLLLGRKKTEENTMPRSSVPPQASSGLKPLYPPPPERKPRTAGLSGDLSGDLSSSLGGFRPSGDLRSGDLRSGDLSGTLPPLKKIDPPKANLNGVVDKIEDKAGDINLAAGAAIAGGAAAAAAAGKAIFDRGKDPSGELRPPEIATSHKIDLSNPLEGLKDKSSNLTPNLDIDNPFEGLKDKAGDTIRDGGAALAGGAALGGMFGSKNTDESELDFEKPTVKVENPLPGIKDKVGDLVPDVKVENPLSDITDKAGDILKDGGAAAALAGGTAIAGGAALAGGAGNAIGNLFGNRSTEEDRSEDLAWEEPTRSGREANNPSTPGDLPNSLKQSTSGITDNVADKAANLLPDDIEPSFGNPFGSLTNKAGDVLKSGGAATVAGGAAALAGGAALFGRDKKLPTPGEADLNLDFPDLGEPTNSLDLTAPKLEALSTEGLDDDPFAGLSDLLGEETGEVKSDNPKLGVNNPLSSLKDRAVDLIEDGKGFGGAAFAGGAAAAVGAGQAMHSFISRQNTPTDSERDEISGNLYSEGQITLVSPNATQAYTHWEIPARLKRQLREQGGQKLAVRLYDVTNADPNQALPTTFKEFECDELVWDMTIPISQTEHRYLTEIGYVTADARWLMLARSAPLWIRSPQP
jgi:ABC-type phosphate transport system substrate-binding protein